MRSDLIQDGSEATAVSSGTSEELPLWIVVSLAIDSPLTALPGGVWGPVVNALVLGNESVVQQWGWLLKFTCIK